MVEADRDAAPQDRQELGTNGGYFMHYPGMKRKTVRPGDLHGRAAGPLTSGLHVRGDKKFEVTGNGRPYYAWMKQQQGELVGQVVVEERHLLTLGTFRDRHAGAYDRWAEGRPWEAETVAQFNDLGTPAATRSSS